MHYIQSTADRKCPSLFVWTPVLYNGRAFTPLVHTLVLGFFFLYQIWEAEWGGWIYSSVSPCPNFSSVELSLCQCVLCVLLAVEDPLSQSLFCRAVYVSVCFVLLAVKTPLYQSFFCRAFYVSVLYTSLLLSFYVSLCAVYF